MKKHTWRLEQKTAKLSGKEETTPIWYVVCVEDGMIYGSATAEDTAIAVLKQVREETGG